MLPLLTLLILVGAGAVLVDRTIRERKLARAAAQAATQTAETSETQESTAQGNWFTRLFQRTSGPDITPQFRTWSKQTFADQPALQNWLDALPEPAFKALADDLDRFCHNLGVDLKWLMEQPANKNSSLLQSLTKIPTHFIQACYQAVTIQDELTATKTYQEFVENPYAKANYAFLQNLFAQLVEAKLTPPISAELFMASETDRQIYVVQVIRQTAEKEPNRFNKILTKTIQAQRESVQAGEKPQSTTKHSLFSIGSSSKSGATASKNGETAPQMAESVAKNGNTPVTTPG